MFHVGHYIFHTENIKMNLVLFFPSEYLISSCGNLPDVLDIHIALQNKRIWLGGMDGG